MGRREGHFPSHGVLLLRPVSGKMLLKCPNLYYVGKQALSRATWLPVTWMKSCPLASGF